MITVVTPADTVDLTTMETFKAELKITGNENDLNIARWIHEASEIIATYCNRFFGLETVRETQRGCWGRMEIILDRFPIREITGVTEDTAALQIADWEVDWNNGLLYRLDGSDSRTAWQGGKVVIDYTAGYDLLDGLPRDLEAACVELVKLRYFSAQRDPLARSVDIPGVISKTYWVGSIAGGDNGALPPSVAALLDPFRRGDGGLS